MWGRRSVDDIPHDEIIGARPERAVRCVASRLGVATIKAGDDPFVVPLSHGDCRQLLAAARRRGASPASLAGTRRWTLTAGHCAHTRGLLAGVRDYLAAFNLPQFAASAIASRSRLLPLNRLPKAVQFKCPALGRRENAARHQNLMPASRRTIV